MKKSLILLASVFMCFITVQAFSATYVLHLAGNCTTQWVSSSDRLANVPGATSINCQVANKTTVAYSANYFKTNYLDVYCKGENWCYIVNHSAGDAIVGYVNANYAPSWNIVYVYTAAGAGGGSEIAIKGISSLFTCAFANELSVSKIRNMYNHNDTNGNIVYRIGGYKGIFGASLLLPGEDDGVVAYHSAGACTKSGSYNELCGCTKWTNHKIYGACKGYYMDHFAVKMKFVNLLGW